MKTPWGWGAIAVDIPPKGWRCPHCGKISRRKDGGRHTYLFGEPRCTPCARAWCEYHTDNLFERAQWP